MRRQGFVMCAWVAAVLGQGPSARDFTNALIQSTRCTPTSTTSACLAYERCKATHRCARGSEEYTIGDAKLEAFDQEFDQGRRSQVQLVNDFEDWKTGVHHWSVPLEWKAPTKFGFDTFHYPLLGSLELASGTVYIDTTTAGMSGDVSFQGMLLQTPQRTTVAVFNFLTIHLGANVQVKLKGRHALCLLSRSSAVVNTHLVSPPGMLGGFPGGGTIAQHNINGPGSSSVRVYTHTVQTSGALEPTVMEIQTSVAAGQTMRGTFTLSNGANVTARIRYDASAEEMQAQLELGLGGVGRVQVTRAGQEVASVGRIWRVSFLTAVGNVPLLTPTSYLTGLDSTVQTRLVAVGNQLSGVFRLRFLGQTSPDLPYNISADGMAAALRAAFDVQQVAVTKDVPTSIERGCTWRIQMTTLRGNEAPTSPSAPVVDAPLTFMTASAADVVVDPVTHATTTQPYLIGKRAQVTISDTAGFSLSYGGKGGRLAANGDLIGGSGGGGGGDSPTDFGQFPRPIFGGAGGGAIYLAAVNDMTLGPNASLAVHGEAGESGIFAGGGGSGGSIVLTSGTSIHIMGTLAATGGLGGRSTQSPGENGSDGEISLHAHAVAYSGAGAIVGGTIHLDIQTQLQLTTDPFVGAAQTAKSLYLAKSVIDPTPTLEGPSFRVFPSQPSRVSYFVRVGATKIGSLQTNRGALFGVHHSSDPTLFVVAIGMMQGALTYSTNARGFPVQALLPAIHPWQWYQVDIFLNWHVLELEIRVNGVSRVAHVPFAADTVDLIGLYTYDAMQTWWDELYVGLDRTMSFHCPTVDSNGRVVVSQPRQRPLWSPAVVGPPTQYSPPIRHYSHLSRRAVYAYDNGGLAPNDGPLHRVYSNDIRDDVFDADASALGMGELVAIAISPDVSIVYPVDSNAERIASTATTLPKESQYWFSEVQLVDANHVVVGGGIGACSTTDLISWRNEGIMLHFANLTDPFGVHQRLVATRPKVVLTRPGAEQQFVMWMHVDNAQNEMGLSGVATADFPNGPYRFQASMYPPGATEAPGGQTITETHDQTVLVSPTNDAYLIQSYYKTVEYWLPRPIMDPLWESVKRMDGSVDYSLNFHRAFFTKDYDNVDDIYLQRFRSEDAPWAITCCDRVTNVCDDSVLIHNEGCPPPYRKQVNGLAQLHEPIRSRYKDPHDPQNNAFRPHSVPSHTDWGFQVYNIKTWRGNYFDALSTNITLAVFKLFAGMASAYAIPSTQEVTYPFASESAAFINTTDPPNMMDFILDTLGVPMSPSFLEKFDDFDMKHMDVNLDGKLTLDEVAEMMKSGQKTLSATAFDAFLVELEALKREEALKLDPDRDGRITYGEFDAWVGLDPALAFDRFDLDKSGYLDENELSRFLMDRQLPRLDAIAIMLDPDFDGRVYYEMFEQFVFQASSVVFRSYDFDNSNDLNASEVALLQADIGVSFLNAPVMLSLLPTNTSTMRLDTYMTWMTASASELRDRVQAFKVDNGLHPTRPDRMTGPQHVVEQRRAKYVSVSKLTPDYVGIEALLVELEGDLDGQGALQDIASLVLQLNFPPTTQSLVPFRQFLAPAAFGQYASYWNGRTWEPRPSAPPAFTYGQQCTDQVRNPDCLPCLTQSPYLSTTVAVYRNIEPTLAHCDNNKELDAYLKQFDHQVSFPLRFQQVARVSSAGVQPHYSPCLNQSESVPCDVLKVYEATAVTPWSLAWESRPVNQGTSVKIRAGPMQLESIGQTFQERFPRRVAEPPFAMCEINSTVVPDQYQHVLGGG
ncbi:hypothetical protein, variant [Aphanomyces invadans]|uniref:EF-hand domain-containing protein n=1 Tax=Aphanomyces invadans TaxID=157072 RepID=A0A024TGV8_9STRA|nr:hypothetical protein, variant [Aphanomyces invadans]ETV93244.1 hypothetical protein, variant [Aphanomyces invadans]|eukprot:XP_008878078.1 hypothetical protein, variant [Aphanomyces invadans]